MAGRDSESDSFTQRAEGVPRRLNDGVKQRIVGALVLAALAVIFLPSLFDREGARYIDVTSQIPAPPDITPIIIAEPQPVKNVEPAPPVNEIFQPEYVEQSGPAPESVSSSPDDAASSKSEKPAAAVAKAEPAKPETKPELASEPQLQMPAEETQLDDHGLPEGWVVQVGAYKEVASADRVRNQLMDAGFRAYTRAVDTPKGRLVRVFVGPKLSRVDAQSDKQKLDKLLKTQTLILRYRA
ncbi:SPOR domain-containing protein [Microbulbifer agarilyticus]|uniref:SPOR domain-containing protein n=1 Tax=Microbulbifer agarilyticus TaxID=260552 RepID=UPI001CD6A6ED|nr:SPOR domain-containing protein [Microbulbifer agarilyticus]MCA0899090.1 SPOR domain-containing protein [Microbulbifer agarilyticus]